MRLPFANRTKSGNSAVNGTQGAESWRANPPASWRDVSPDTDPSDPLLRQDVPQGPQNGPKGREAELLVEMVEKSWEESRRWRRASESDWLVDLAFTRGHQWVEYNSASGMLQRIACCDWDDPEEAYYYKTVNVVGRVCATLANQMVLNRPSALFVPRSSSPMDVQAAAEERAIDAHLDNVLRDAETLFEAVEMAQCTTTVIEYQWWDKDAEAEVPTGYGPDGTPAGFRSAPVGDVCRELLTFANFYPDPAATSLDTARWVVIDTVRPLDDVLDEYGRAARGVEPDAYANDAEFLQSRLAWLNTERGGPASARAKNSVHLKTMWVRPGTSRKYPKGAYLVTGGKRLLRFDPWPYARKDWFFLSPLSFFKPHGTFWALNNVGHARGQQMEYNQTYSNLYDQVRNDKTYILMPEGARAGVDAYTTGRNEEVITVALGAAQMPVIQPRPPINQHHWLALQNIKTEIEDIMGGRDIGRGIAPSPDTSGVAVNSLQQANAVQIQQFKSNVDEFVRRRSEGRLEFYRQYGTEIPRLLALSGEGDPNAARQDVLAFRAMRAGGRSRVTIQAGSAMPRLPENVQQRIMDLAKMGLFSPENLPGTIPLLEALEVDGGDELAAKLRKELTAIQQQQAAMQPNPAQVQQMKSEAAAQQQQAQMQHEAQMQAIQEASDERLETFKAQTQAQLEAMKAHLQMQSAIIEKHIPSVALAGKLGSQSTVSAEEAAGLTPDDPGEIKEMNKPKPAAPAGGKAASKKPASKPSR